MIIKNNRGQFFPMTIFVVFTSVVFLLAAVNVYRVARAKLLAQNIADAAALAVAALEAKQINVVIDRDEWMNHMYPDNTTIHNKNQLPNISDTNARNWNGYNSDEKAQYAQLVATINQAQQMFQAAYNRFLGAGNGTAGSGGPGGLIDILSEIAGAQDPSVQLIVYNNENGKSLAKDVGTQMAANPLDPATQSSGSGNIHAAAMSPVPMVTEDLTIGGNQKLSAILKMPSNQKVGWIRPQWENLNGQNSLQVNTGSGPNKTVIGAGAIVIKTVKLMAPFIPLQTVTASASAYVVQSSGQSVAPNSGGTKTPPTNFRPTYYVRLGYPQ